MTEAIRRATPADVVRLAELTAEAVAEQVGSRGGAVWSEREARPVPATGSLESDLADDDRLVLVGTYHGAVVGYAAAGLETLRNGELLGVIGDIYVEPGARAVGVGEGLIETVLDWCRRRGCLGVDALALPGNRETKNFFETFGFTARALVVHRRIATEPSPGG